jgi:hypothetical protein
MTNTYSDDATEETKLLEEIRCLRCVMERVLRVMDEGLFVDYQMEKFGNDRAHHPIIAPFAPANTGTRSAPGYPQSIPPLSVSPCHSCTIMIEFMQQHPNGYVGDTPCDMCSNNPRKVTCSSNE